VSIDDIHIYIHIQRGAARGELDIGGGVELLRQVYFIYTYISLFIHSFIYMCVCVCVCACMCIYICMCVCV